MVFAPAAEGVGDGDAASSALDTYRAWLLDKYRRFIRALRKVLQASRTPDALRAPVLDTLLVMASLEVRHSRPGKGPHLGALDAAGGAFREAVAALSRCAVPLGPELLARLK